MAILFPMTSTLYALALIASLLHAFSKDDRRRRTSGVLSVFGIFLAWILQGAMLSVAFSGPALGEHANAFQLVSWGIALTFMILSASTRMLKTGWVFISLMLLFMLISSLAGDSASLAIQGTPKIRVWASIHLSASFLSFAALMVQALIASLYLLKEHSLKEKSWVLIAGIPPLDRLYLASSYLIWIGFLLLTTGLLSGGGLSKILYHAYFTNDLRETLTLITWIFYALLVNLRFSKGFHGRRFMMASLFSFIGLAISLGVAHRP